MRPSTDIQWLQVKDIFRIERNGEGERFAKSPFSKLKSSDRRLLVRPNC